MAYIWLFSICVGSVENAAKVKAAFGEPVVKVGGKEINLLIQVEEYKAEVYINVCPYSLERNFALWPSNGPGSEEEAVEMTATGQELLSRLHYIPAEAPYLFATLGVECGAGWRTSEEVVELIGDWDHHEPIGVVVSEELWKAGGSPTTFREFSPGYRFDGWAGEKFEG